MKNKLKNICFTKSFFLGLFCLCFLSLATPSKASFDKLKDVYQFNGTGVSSILTKTISGDGVLDTNSPFITGNGSVYTYAHDYYYVIASGYNIPVVNSSFAISFWWKTDTTYGYYLGQEVYYIHSATGGETALFGFNPNSNYEIFSCCWAPGSFSSVTYEFTPSISANTWHFWTFDINNTGIIVYLDGVKYATGVFSNTQDFSNYHFGEFKRNNSNGLAKISISDLGIYNEALTDSEVAAIYNSDISVYNYTPAPIGVSITSNTYNPVTGNVFLTGTCIKQGSGQQQMDLYAYEAGTSTPDYLNRLYPERSVLVDCQNDGTWTSVYNGAGLTGTDRLVIDDTFYGTTLASVDITWQTVKGYIRTNYPDNTITIDTTSSDGATTTLNFIYNICDDPEYSATTSKIWIINQTGTRFTNTSFGAQDYYSATTCSGTGTYTFHLEQGETGTVRAYFAYANGYGVQYLTSGLFYLVASNNIQPCYPPTYDIGNICAGIASSTLGDIQCGLKYGLVSSGQFLFYPSCSSLNTLSTTYGQFKRSFPFNTFYDLTDSIDTAINTSLTTTTPQNFSIPFVKPTSTGAQIYMLPVMSSTTISNSIGSTNYGVFQMTIGYIWWILIALIAFFVVVKL